MARNPFRFATALGSILQVGMALLGLAFPVLQQGNLYPIGGTCLALLSGFLFARWLSGRALPPALLGGAFAGGFSSFLGTAVAALTGQSAPRSADSISAAGNGTGSAGAPRVMVPA